MEITILLLALVGLHTITWIISELTKSPLALLSFVVCAVAGALSFLNPKPMEVAEWQIQSGLLFSFMSLNFLTHHLLYNKFSNKPRVRVITRDKHWRVQKYAILSWQDIQEKDGSVEFNTQREATAFAKAYNEEVPGWKIIKK